MSATDAGAPPGRLPPAAAIVGCTDTVFAEDEAGLFAEADPFGLILFKRNVETPDQLRRLTDRFRDLTGRADAPILIDQEGGRVRRLGPPHWPADPSPGRFAAAATGDIELALAAIRAFAIATALDLRALGITVNAVPCLDLAIPGQSDVIGDRSFGREAGIVVTLADALVAGYRAAGVQIVMKHIPGHGRATVDSHADLPRITADRQVLAEDMLPFAAFARAGAASPPVPWAMTAHVVYTALDPTRPATLSPRILQETIREQIGFDGLLVSDDLTMGALTGPVPQRAEAAIAAGCDVALHCSGTVASYAETLRRVGPLSPEALTRWERAKRWAAAADPDILARGSAEWRREGQDCLDRALRAADA